MHQAALRLSTNFLTLVEVFKAKQIQAAQKSFARSSAKPNSTVAALIEEENRKRVLDSLVPSSGTLIVVPGVLMEHWQVGRSNSCFECFMSVDSQSCIPLALIVSAVGSTETACESCVLHHKDSDHL
jgi:hypothetical protein